jgi:hypothetical protein
MKSKKPIVSGEIMILKKNRYRLTFRDGGGKMHQSEVMAPSMSTAVSGNNTSSDLVKVERIHPSTGEVLGGFYNE